MKTINRQSLSSYYYNSKSSVNLVRPPNTQGSIQYIGIMKHYSTKSRQLKRRSLNQHMQTNHGFKRFISVSTNCQQSFRNITRILTCLLFIPTVLFWNQGAS